jgi:hypothetical protein
MPYLVTRIVARFDLGLSESTLTLVFPFKRCEKNTFSSIFGKFAVSELKIRAYHFFMGEIRSVYRGQLHCNHPVPQRNLA